MPNPATLPRHVQYTSNSAVAVLAPETRNRSSNQGTSVTTKYRSGSEVKRRRLPCVPAVLPNILRQRNHQAQGWRRTASFPCWETTVSLTLIFFDIENGVCCVALGTNVFVAIVFNNTAVHDPAVRPRATVHTAWRKAAVVPAIAPRLQLRAAMWRQWKTPR
jgi:hypothetical protein